MDACKASAKDFCETLLFCLEDDGIFTKEDGSLDEDFKKDYKEFLDYVLAMHYDTDIGEQGENITKYLDECGYYDEEDYDDENFKEKLTLLQNEEHKIGKWLKEAGYTTDENCIGACFGPINEHHQIRAMDFEYNGNIKDLDNLDIDKLAKSIAENVIDDRFSVRVSIYDEEDGEAYKNLFCVEIWLNE